MTASLQLLAAWRELLRLCELRASETALVLVGDQSHPEHVEAVRFVLAESGARHLVMQLGQSIAPKMAGESTAYYGPTALSGNAIALEAMKATDLIVDLMGMYRGAEQEQMLAAGSRIILVKEPPEIFMRLAPSANDRRRVKAAEKKIMQGRTMTVRSAAGTEFSVALGQYPCLAQYGFADEAGRWDHCPSAFIARWPDERSGQGTVVLDAGDTILPFKSYVQTPIRIQVRDGFITTIDGGLDAKYLRDYMAQFRDPDAYAVSHLGWGLHDRAQWTALGLYDKRQTNGMDARSYQGNFMFSTGPNAEAGGSRHTPCHLDIPMSGCSVWVDQELMVDAGTIVPDEQRE